MKKILMTMTPQMWNLMEAGVKKMDLRTTKPKCDTPFKVIVNVTGGEGIVGEFICNDVKEIKTIGEYIEAEKLIFVNAKYIWEYSRHGQRKIYGWNISDATRYEKPRKISDYGLTKAPRTWQYIKEENR